MKRKKRTVREELERHRRRRLLVEAKKLNPKEERALAEEGMISEESTPSREDLVHSALAVCGKYADPEGACRVAVDHDRHLAVAEGYRAMAGEDRETAERHVAAFREILE